MFFSLQEAAEKLNMTEEQVVKLVREGRLREFRDGANVLFKVDEVEALMPDTDVTASQAAPGELEQAAPGELEQAAPDELEQAAPDELEQAAPDELEQAADTDTVSLTPETTGDTTAASESELAEADTVIAGEGIDVLGETDSEAQITDDTAAETKGTAAEEASLEEIEEDVNLDTFGSGSGLLDLSLQADDTSLGGILDEIYTAEGDQETSEGSALELTEEEAEEEAGVEPMLPEEEELAAPEPILEVPAMARAYAEPLPDTVSSAFGYMLFLPLLAILYTAIVAVAGFNNVMPAVLEKIQSINGPYGIHLIWYVAVGVAVLSMSIVGIAFMLSSGGPKAAKRRKPKKAKKPKAKP
jgi:excisionase family DNA binding protein